MNTLLLVLIACEEKNVEDSGFFDIDIETDTNDTDTDDTTPPDTSDTNGSGSSGLEIVVPMQIAWVSPHH